ncbi:MAG TPA: hypothetical protein VMP11_19275 [Verrucomicrobiae bacterium]|nr:hypothetical protein [Verrucomicrobiae bacterium]
MRFTMNQTGTVVRGFQTETNSTKRSLIDRRFFSRMGRGIAAGAAALAFLAGVIQTQAQLTNGTWTWQVQSGAFNVPANWDSNSIPPAGANVLFTNNTSYTITLGGSDTPFLYNTIFTNQTGVTTLDASGNTWVSTNIMSIGAGLSTTTVYVVGGNIYAAGRTAPLVNGQLRIADSGTNIYNTVANVFVTGGVLGADAGSVGTAANSSGKLVVSGPGQYTDGGSGSPSQLTIGNGGANCQLIVTNGGVVQQNGTITIGVNVASSNCFALFSGPTSLGTMTADGIIMHGNGGLLVVSNGATVWMHDAGTIGSNSSFNTGVVDRATFYVGGAFQIGANTAGGTDNYFEVRNGSVFTCGGSLQYGNNSLHVRDGMQMGGVGLMSTGFAVVVRSNGTTTNHFGNFFTVTNAFFSTQYLNPQGPEETISVLSKGTFLITNGLATESNSNGVNLAGNAESDGQDDLLVDGGTFINILDPSMNNGGNFVVGGVGNNSVIVTNGGHLFTSSISVSTTGNSVIVTGPGSVLSNYTSVAGFTNIITLGTGTGNSNTFGVYNGGFLYNNGTFDLGNNITSVYNRVFFGGPGLPAVVNNLGSLNIGSTGTSVWNSVSITNASVNITTLNVGNSGAYSNTFEMDGGTLNVTFVRVRPTNTVVFNGGTINAGGLTFDSLANIVGTSTNNPFVVGNGTAPAVYNMVAGGSGYHNFNNGGLVVTNNATLAGNGTIAGAVTVYGSFVPGFASTVGSIYASNAVSFAAGAQLDYDLGTLSDSVTVGANLGLGGVLNVSDSGGFGAGSYTIFTYGGGLTNTGGGTLTMGTAPAGFTYSIITNVAGFVTLQVSSGSSGDLYTTWQTHYFGGSSSTLSFGTANPTGDGMNNTNKFLAGFNPTNGPAYLHVISVAKSSANVVVTYLGASGDTTYTGGPSSRTNVLEFTTGTANGSYSNNFASTGQTNILSGGTGFGLVTSFIDTNGATSSSTRYYRVRVLVP